MNPLLPQLDAAAVHAALPWPALEAALSQAFLSNATAVPLRSAQALSAQDSLLLMPAWNPRLIVVKLVTVMPLADPTVQACLLALNRRNGQALALIDGEAVTLRRTAVASALAARHMARANAHRLLIVGSGRLAGWMARAHAALRPALSEIAIWGRHPPAAQALVETLCGEGLPARLALDLRRETSQADIVCCATTSTAALIRGEWLAPGCHLDLVGGFKPTMREADDDAVARCRIVVDTLAGALAEAGDLTQPLANGRLRPDQVLGELAQLLRREIQARRDDADITLFKSVGTALEDLAAAELILDQIGLLP